MDTPPRICHAFNTGRLYTEAGQRLAWTVIAPNRVAFIDLDRMIEYVLTLDTSRGVTNRDVLHAYDYGDGSCLELYRHRDAFDAVKAALYEAARAAPVASTAPRFGRG